MFPRILRNEGEKWRKQVSKEGIVVIPPGGGGRGQIMGTAVAVVAILAVLNFGPFDIFSGGGHAPKEIIQERVLLEKTVVEKTEAEGRALAAHARCDEKLKACESWRDRLLTEIDELRKKNEQNYRTIENLAAALENKIDPFGARTRARGVRAAMPEQKRTAWWRFWTRGGDGVSDDASDLDARAVEIEKRLAELERRAAVIKMEDE